MCTRSSAAFVLVLLLVLSACGGPSDPKPPEQAAEQPTPRTLQDVLRTVLDDVLLAGIDDPYTIVDWAYVEAVITAQDRVDPKGWGRGMANGTLMPTEEEARAIALRLRRALPRKRGAALLAAISTISQLGHAEGPAFREAAIRAWPQTDAATREWWLREMWDAVRDPRMEPQLLADIEACPQDRRGQWHVDDVYSIALQRYVDLVPEKGRPIVLADIARKAPRFGGVALKALPDEQLEEVEANYRRPIEELTHWSFEWEMHGPLGERYGGPDTLKTALKLLDLPTFMHNTNLLRVVMSQDREEGFRRMAKALATRDAKHPYRHRLVLESVLASNFIEKPSYWGPDAEAFTRRYLSDEDPKVAEAAKQLLEAQKPPVHTADVSK